MIARQMPRAVTNEAGMRRRMRTIRFAVKGSHRVAAGEDAGWP
jgi:hypothetical protein